jgi:hypothetical protein
MNDLTVVRRALFVLLAIGVTGTGVDLILIEHYEDTVQLVPISATALALMVLAWHAATGSAWSLRALQMMMAVFVVAGAAGIWFHYQGGAAFQLEIDPSQSGWEVFKQVVRIKAPPLLASGVLVQLGLLGFVYAYRHPALESPGVGSSSLGA